MKLILVIFAVFSVASAVHVTIKITPQRMAQVLPIIHKCEAEANSPPNAFQNLLKGIIEDDASLKFSACLLKDTGHVDEEGRLIASTFNNYLKNDKEKEELQKTLDECYKAQGKNYQDNTGLGIKCFLETSSLHLDGHQ